MHACVEPLHPDAIIGLSMPAAAAAADINNAGATFCDCHDLWHTYVVTRLVQVAEIIKGNSEIFWSGALQFADLLEQPDMSAAQALQQVR
jgi:hypothetical protein